MTKTTDNSPTTPPETIEALQIRIRAAWQKAVSSIVETGKVLLEIRQLVPHGDWGRLFTGPNKPPFSSRMAGMLMSIADHAVLSNPKHASNLPASWYCLLLLASLEAERLELLIGRGTVHAEMQRAEIEGLLRSEKSRARRMAIATMACSELPQPAPISDYRSPEQQAALQNRFNFKPDVGGTLRHLRGLLVDLQDIQDEIRRDSHLRKELRSMADRLLTIAEGDPVLLLPEHADAATTQLLLPSN